MFLLIISLIFGGLTAGCGDDNPINPRNQVDSTAVITGLVMDSESSDPISGATVSSDQGDSTISADDGSYNLEIKLGNRTITAAAEGYEPFSQDVEVVDNDTITVDCEMVPDMENAVASVSGHVWDAETNLGVPSAVISFGDDETSTDGEGAYSIELSPDTYAVSVDADGYEPATAELEFEGGRNYVHDFTLEIDADLLGTVRGVVRDSNTGEAIEGAVLAAEDVEVTADSSGAYEMLLPPGSYVIIASARNHESIAEEVDVEAGGVYTVNFTLAPSGGGGDQTGTVGGTVINATTLNPISGASVSSAGQVTQTGPNGRYSFAIPIGFQNVSASAGGYLTSTRSLMVANGGIYNLDFALTPEGGGGETGTVSGTVRNAQNSAAIQGAIVSAGGRSTTTNANGQYSFAVPVGSQVVTANAAGFQTSTQNVNVTDGGNHTVNFSLTPGGGGETGTIAGRVTDASNNHGIYLAQVECFGVTTYTDYSGMYQMQVTAGARTMNVSTVEYEPQSRNVVVVAGQTTTQNFALQPTAGEGTGGVYGWVRNTSGNPILGARVTSDDGFSASTNASGYYSFDVNAGNRTFTATAAGYSQSQRTVLIIANRSTQVDFTLSP